MPSWDPGLPGWVDFVLIVLVAAVTSAGGFAAVFSRRANKSSKEAEKNTQHIKEQIVNSHPSNIRDDIDTLTRAVGRIEVHVDNIVKDLDASVRGVEKSIRSVQHSLDRRTKIQEQALAEATQRGRDELELLRSEIRLNQLKGGTDD